MADPIKSPIVNICLFFIRLTTPSAIKMTAMTNRSDGTFFSSRNLSADVKPNKIAPRNTPNGFQLPKMVVASPMYP